MGLFDNAPLVQLAVDVGRLTEQVAALRASVEQATALATQAINATQHAPVPISANIAAVIQSLAGGDGELGRHLEQEARVLIAQGVQEAHVIHLLQAGSR